MLWVASLEHQRRLGFAKRLWNMRAASVHLWNIFNIFLTYSYRMLWILFLFKYFQFVCLLNNGSDDEFVRFCCRDGSEAIVCCNASSYNCIAFNSEEISENFTKLFAIGGSCNDAYQPVDSRQPPSTAPKTRPFEFVDTSRCCAHNENNLTTNDNQLFQRRRLEKHSAQFEEDLHGMCFSPFSIIWKVDWWYRTCELLWLKCYDSSSFSCALHSDNFSWQVYDEKLLQRHEHVNQSNSQHLEAKTSIIFFSCRVAACDVATHSSCVFHAARALGFDCRFVFFNRQHRIGKDSKTTWQKGGKVGCVTEKADVGFMTPWLYDLCSTPTLFLLLRPWIRRFMMIITA